MDTTDTNAFSSGQVAEFWNRFKQDTGRENAEFGEEFMFCGGGPLADDLAQLVLSGKKTATSCVAVTEADQADLPVADGRFDIVLDSAGNPVAIIRDIQILRNKFFDVPERIAYLEGEGDQTLEHWRNAHEAFFREEFAEEGVPFSAEDLDVYTEIFELCYPLVSD